MRDRVRDIGTFQMRQFPRAGGLRKCDNDQACVGSLERSQLGNGREMGRNSVLTYRSAISRDGAVPDVSRV